MIEINLIPRAAKKDRTLQKIIALAVLVLLVLGSSMGWIYLDQSSKITALAAEDLKLREDLKKYADIQIKLDKLEEDKKQLNRRFEIIDKLVSDRLQWVKLLDFFSKELDQNLPNVWAIKIKEDRNNKVVWSCYCDGKDDAANFMVALKKSNLVRDVTLLNFKYSNVNGTEIGYFEVAAVRK